MEIFLVAFGVFAIAVLGMAIGVVISNRRIKGSCGGLATMRGPDGRPMCGACGESPEACATDVEPQSAGQGRDDCRGEACENFGECDGSARRPASAAGRNN